MQKRPCRNVELQLFYQGVHRGAAKQPNMADLLGSILGSMQKPPSLGEEEKKKAKGNVKNIYWGSNI